MNNEQFNNVFDEVVEMSSAVLVAKGTEYSDGVDRLHNFKQAAHLQRMSPREALSGMMAKHTVSVYDLINGEDTPPIEKWDEKILDHINYLILLRALVVEELEGNL